MRILCRTGIGGFANVEVATDAAAPRRRRASRRGAAARAAAAPPPEPPWRRRPSRRGAAARAAAAPPPEPPEPPPGQNVQCRFLINIKYTNKRYNTILVFWGNVIESSLQKRLHYTPTFFTYAKNVNSSQNHWKSIPNQFGTLILDGIFT